MSDTPSPKFASNSTGIDPELVAPPQPTGAGPLHLNEVENVPMFAGDLPTTEPEPPARDATAVSDAAPHSDTAANATEPHDETATDRDPDLISDDEQPPIPTAADAPSATASAAAAGESATTKRQLRGLGRKRVRSKLPAAPAPRTRRAPRSRAAQARTDRRRAAFARSVGILAATGTLVGTVWALGWMPLPEHRAQAPQAVITPQPGEQVRVCPGPLQQLGLTSRADQVTAVGEPTQHSASFAKGEPNERSLADGGAIAFTVDGMNGETHSQLGVSQGLSVSGKSSSGYSATACTQPAPTQWLLAGNTTEGQNAVLDVINPGNVPARVNFAVYTEAGVVRPTIPEAVIEPGERKQVSLAGVAAHSEAIAIRVDATGTAVVAYVHQTAIATLDPKGSDIAGSTTLPATQQVIAGMHVIERPVQDDDAPTTIGSVVRMMNPGEKDVTATVTFLRSNGEATEMQVPLNAGRVTDMPVTTLPEGDYTVVVEAETPILAAGRVAPLDGSEFAWLSASPELQGKTMVAIAQGPNPKLALANPSDEERTLTVNGAEVRVRPRTTVYMDEPAGASITLDQADGIYAAVYYSGSGELSAAPVLLGNPDATPIRVVG